MAYKTKTLVSGGLLICVSTAMAASYPISKDDYDNQLRSRNGFSASLGDLRQFSDSPNPKSLVSVLNATQDDCIQKQMKELDKAQSQLGITDSQAKGPMSFQFMFNVSLADTTPMNEEIAVGTSYQVTVYQSKPTNRYLINMSAVLHKDGFGKLVCTPVDGASLAGELSFRLGKQNGASPALPVGGTTAAPAL